MPRTVESTILDGITDSLFTLDAAGCFVFISAKAAEILGQPVSKLLEQKFCEALVADRESDFYIHITRAFAGRTPVRFEHFCARLNGWFEHQVYIQAEGGITIYGRDVTAHHQIGEALHASEERFGRLRNIVEASKVLALSLDHDKTLKDLARFLATSVGEWCVIMLREGETVQRAAVATRDDGKHASIHPVESRSWSVSQLHCLRSVFQKGSSERVEIKNDDDPWLGTLFPERELQQTILMEFPQSVIAVPLPSRGKISGALLLGSGGGHPFTADDLHSIEEVGRRAGSALEHARLYREAQEANRLKDEFVSIVSHELRTPLTPILGAVYMLRAEPTDRKIFARALDLIERNANAQARIVEDLLDMSRVISGKMRLALQPVDIPSTINAAVAALRSASDAKGIEIRLQLQPLNGTVYGDETRLQQVVWNLLANSVKFTPVSGSVSVDLRDVGGHAEIQVVDDGIGIAPEFLPFVFDGFRQQDGSRTRVHGGLGLGLAIVRHVVELHGGTVQALSAGDRPGCTFVVKLPLRAATAQSVSA